MNCETKKCQYCGGEILSDAIKCKHCREFLHGLMRSKTEKKRWYEKTFVNLLVASVLVPSLILFGLGFIHIITGSNLNSPFHIEYKDSFGLSESFINIDKITGMPWIAAQTKYPIGCRILTNKGYIESDKDFKNKIRKEIADEVAKTDREFAAAFDQIKRQTETGFSDDQLAKLRKCQLAYLIEGGLASTGMSFGEFLDRLSDVTESAPALTTSIDGQTIVTISRNGRTLRLLFACDPTSGVCMVTGGQIDLEEIDSRTALAIILTLTCQ